MRDNIIFEYIDIDIRYVIIRRHIETDRIEYFNGCMKYGRDSECVPKIHRSVWDTSIHERCLYRNIEYAKSLLYGIVKYDLNPGYAYFICEYKTKSEINANAPVGNVIVK